MGNAFFITFFGKEVEKLWILKNNLNNNAILVEDQSKNERIILGKAIGYGKKIGSVIDLEKAQIEKNYVIFDHDSVKAFQELIKRIHLIGLKPLLKQTARSFKIFAKS